MTDPKQAAEQIVGKFWHLHDMNEKGKDYLNMSYEAAKACAILHCQGIIDEFPQGYNGNFEEKRKQFWKDVLNEMNKL